MKNITRENLKSDRKYLEDVVKDAMDIYANVTDNNNFIEEFKRYMKETERTDKINMSDFKKFFNQRLILEYGTRLNIPVTSENIEEISNIVLNDIRKIPGKTVLTNNVDVVYNHSFHFNISNTFLIELLSSCFSLYSSKQIPYCIMINRDLVNSKDALIIKATDDTLDESLKVIDQFISKNEDKLLKPMPILKNIYGVVGYEKDDFVDYVSQTLNEIVKEVLNSSIPAENMKEKIKQSLKEKLEKQFLGEEIVIDVAKPVIEIVSEKEANVVSELETLNSEIISENRDVEMIAFEQENIVPEIKDDDLIVEDAKKEPVKNDEKLFYGLDTKESNHLLQASPEELIVDKIIAEELSKETQKESPEMMMEEDRELKVHDNQSKIDGVVLETPVIPKNSTPIGTSEIADIVSEYQNESQNQEEKLSEDELSSVVENLETSRIERAQKYSNLVEDISILNRKMIGINGETTTLLDYLDEENVLAKIPKGEKITLAEGITMSGEEFIKTKLIPYALEVGNTNIDVIMDSYGAKIGVPEEKVGFFKKLFK